VTTDPPRHDVLRRFRQLVRDAHPDHGATAVNAGERISELTQAKRILLAR
jgi:DnaJ-class molecular chaperone